MPLNTLANIDLHKLSTEELNSLRQIIPEEMMAALKKSSADKGISLDAEISTRLLATFIEPHSFSIDTKLNKLLQQKLVSAQAKTESALRRKGWLYVYELDKLRILLAFKDKLPKKFKETFSLIDVAKESARILAEQNNNTDEHLG